MNPLRLLIDAFVNTFGITRPSPSQEKVAGRVILGMLIAVLIGLGIAFLLMRAAMTH
jgi:high-affinity Fe2+/Pb2+ permease